MPRERAACRSPVRWRPATRARFFGDDSRYYNRVDFSGVEKFVVKGGSGNDGIRTGDADDMVFGGGGADLLTSGDGNDFLSGGSAADTLDGGGGIDTADYSDKTDSVVVTLDKTTAVAVQVGVTNEDAIFNIENVTGGSANDTLKGDGLANRLDGGSGNDKLNGGTGKRRARGWAWQGHAHRRQRPGPVRDGHRAQRV
jgi:Ca2+-binding RTX toxin-like protein